MYKKILIPLENSNADETILAHITQLARLTGAELLLIHVADGWVARNFEQLNLRESEEMREDTAYLEQTAEQMRREGFSVSHRLALGDPAQEITRVATEEHVDLIAMSTHGHRFISDLLYGSTADKVRHETEIPVLLLKAKKK